MFAGGMIIIQEYLIFATLVFYVSYFLLLLPTALLKLFPAPARARIISANLIPARVLNFRFY